MAYTASGVSTATPQLIPAILVAAAKSSNAVKHQLTCNEQRSVHPEPGFHDELAPRSWQDSVVLGRRCPATPGSGSVLVASTALPVRQHTRTYLLTYLDYAEFREVLLYFSNRIDSSNTCTSTTEEPIQRQRPNYKAHRRFCLFVCYQIFRAVQGKKLHNV